MAYSELIKNFNRVRDYMREFYIYGFKSREEFTRKSARSYDDERRRLESWLGEYMGFRQTSDGKNVFISIDSRLSNHNPLYKGCKTKSFTDGDITLHFILFDILSAPEISMSLREITAEVDEILSAFDEPRCFDESTVRKKLKEYVSEGLITAEKKGKVIYYSRAADVRPCGTDCLDFFSEVAPCGVVGSYLLDRIDDHESHFAFKHHYITGAMDSEILYYLFIAMREKRSIALETINRRKDIITENHVVPLKVFISVQNGRQYLMAYAPRFNRITSFRIDNILSVKIDDECQEFDGWREKLQYMQPHMWGVS
ncbi:MAG: WYL domain-containing protein, partial [Bacillota bacterium]|nr:WYL domain-containing protein [Bacillota bacterium]